MGVMSVGSAAAVQAQILASLQQGNAQLTANQQNAELAKAQGIQQQNQVQAQNAQQAQQLQQAQAQAAVAAASVGFATSGFYAQA